MKPAKPQGLGTHEFRSRHDPTFKMHDTSARFERELDPKARCFVIVAAQNATPVDPEWWRVLLAIAEARKAELLVLALRYKNPTSQWTGSQSNAEFWVDEVRPYLWNVRRPLNENLTLLGDLKIQPTATDPLTGAEALSMQQSGIIGHTKLQLRAIPTPASSVAKILTTTGACTVENYTDSRAGRIAAFHHSLSAVIVEIVGRKFHLRHVHYDRKTRSATDLDTRFTAAGPAPAPRPLALVMGDTHVDFICPNVYKATFGPNGMVKSLRPEYLLWHDLLDGYSCNPHHDGNPFSKIAKLEGKRSSVRAELDRAIDFVRQHTPTDSTSVIVGSNHNDFLSRWINRQDWRTDPGNAEFYLRTALAMVQGTKLTLQGAEYPDPFRYWFRLAEVPGARVLDEDESFQLAGVELGMHGDRGPNGTRGSTRNLRRIGVKSFKGHSHVPEINEGCYSVGTSTQLRLEYNKGPSSWHNCHGLLHADGKRQLVLIIDGRWRAD